MNANPFRQYEQNEGHAGHAQQQDQDREQPQSEATASEPDGHDHDQDDDVDQDDDDDHHHHTEEQPYDEQALAAAVEAANWPDLIKRLIAYVSFRLLRFTSAKRSGLGADDFAQQAITLVLTGKRRLNLTGDATLFSQLCSVCDSLVSHEAEKALRRIKGGMAEVSIVADEDEGAPPDQVAEDHLGTPASFEIELIARDRFECFARSLEPRLAGYVRLRVTGCYATAEEYAQALSTTVQAIRNMDRQLWRRRNLYDLRDSRQTLRGKPCFPKYKLAMGA